MSAPYDPRAAALDALAAMRWPDVSEPPVEQVEAATALLRASYGAGALRVLVSLKDINTAWRAGREGRPLAPPK